MKTKPATVAGLLAALLLPLAASAQDAETVTVLATGFGVDPDAAKKAAGRAAIEQVVGQLVDAETLVENDELVKDRILTYSGAFLEDVETVGAPAQADGLWTVKVRATVRRTKLAQKLQAENVGTVALKKGKLFAQAASRRQEAGDAAAMVKAAFEGFPKNVVRFEVCKNEDGTPAVAVSDADGTVTVEASLAVDPAAWKEWAAGLVQKLEPMAAKAESARWNTQGGGDGRLFANDRFLFFRGASMKNRWGAQDRAPGFRLGVATSYRAGTSGFSVREFDFSDNNAASVLDAVWSGLPQEATLTVSLLADDEVLESKSWRLREVAGGAVLPKWGGMATRKDNANFCLFPGFCHGGTDTADFLAAGRIALSLGKLSPDVLADATDVRTDIRFFVPGPETRDIGDRLVPLED